MNLKDSQLKLFEVKEDNKITSTKVLANSSKEAIEIVRDSDYITDLKIKYQIEPTISVNEILDTEIHQKDINLLKNGKINFILSGEFSPHINEIKDNIFYGLDIKDDLYSDYFLFKKEKNIIWATHLWCYKEQFNEKTNIVTATYVDRIEPRQFHVFKIKSNMKNLSLDKLYVISSQQYSFMDLSVKITPKNYMFVDHLLSIKDANVHKILVDNKEFLKSNFLKSKERV